MPVKLNVGLKAATALLLGRSPGQLVIQFTDSCNARCPQCGMSVDNRFPRSKLEPVFVWHLLRVAASRGVVSVSLTGGEPLLYADEVFALLSEARALGIPFTRTGTNGFMFRAHLDPAFPDHVHTLGSRLRDARVHSFWISLDSADPDVHERNRGLPGVVEGIRKALPILHARGVYPVANLGLNRSMGRCAVEERQDLDTFSAQVRRALREFFEAVIDLGFTMANVCYPMDLDGTDPAIAYQATSSAGLVRFTRRERETLFEVLGEVTREFRTRIRIFTPLSSLEALARQYRGDDKVAPCRGGMDYFYVSAADGHLYPCGFRGTESLGDATEPANWRRDTRSDCRRCDWECFRDPSQVLAPLAGLLLRPDRRLRWLVSDPGSVRTWYQDWRYFSACGYFATFRPPRPDRLAGFETLASADVEGPAVCSTVRFR